MNRFLAVVGSESSSNNNPDSLNYLPAVYSKGSRNRRTFKGSDKVYVWPVRFSEHTGPGGVVLAVTNSVWIKKDNTVEGDVVANSVNDPVVLPTLQPGVEAQIDLGSSIDGSLQADSVGNEPGASTSEGTQCNDVQGLGSLTCENPDPLLFPIVGLPFFQATETDTDTAAVVSVGNNQSTTLAAGTYRDVSLGKNSSVCFAGGNYDIRSIIGVESGQNLAFQAPSEVRVDGDVTLGSSPFIGADDGSYGCTGTPGSPLASDVFFFIAGDNVSTGAGKRNGRGNLNANFYLGSGAMETGKDTDIDGAIIARDYTMNRGSNLTRNSAFAFGEIPTDPAADPQEVVTDGGFCSVTTGQPCNLDSECSGLETCIANDLEIILTGSDPQAADLSFTISVQPVTGSVSIPVGFTGPVLTLCSVSLTACTVDAECPASEFCADTFCTSSSGSTGEGCNGGGCPVLETCTVQLFPPVTSASAIYSPANATNAPEDFTFQVDNGSAQAAAGVDINSNNDPALDPPAIATVEAFDGAAETTPSTTVTIRLRGEAPCTTFDLDPESPECLVGVGLTFAIGTACGDTDLGQPDNCASPSSGSITPPVPDSATVVRTATTDYTPTGPAGTTDSFKFEVCGTIGASPVCDIAEVSVSIEAPLTLAENLEVSIEAMQEVTIPLVGNPGGAAGAAPASVDAPRGLLAVGSDPSGLPLYAVVNLLTNPDFVLDPTIPVNGWTAVGTGTLSHNLLEGDPALPSARADNVLSQSLTLQQCVGITGGTAYDFSARSFTHRSDGTSTNSVSVSFFSSADCTGFLSNVPTSTLLFPSWALREAFGVVAPASANSARMELFADAGPDSLDTMNISWDNVILGESAATPGRLVYIGTDPSSDQHFGSAGPPLPNAASHLAANAARWAGDDSNPAIGCVEGDSAAGSQVEVTLVSEGLACASVILVADLDTTDLSNFDVLYTGAAGSDLHVDELVAASGQVLAFVNSGGGLVAETNVFAINSWTWVPFADDISHSGDANLGGAEVLIVQPTHPVMQGLTDAFLSDWGISVHSTFLTPGDAGFQVLALGDAGASGEHQGSGTFEPYIIVQDPGVNPPLVFEIVELPDFGTLRDSNLTLITTTPYLLPDTTVIYTSTSFPTTLEGFSYRVTEGALLSTAFVSIIVSDSCAEQGRPPGCVP